MLVKLTNLKKTLLYNFFRQWFCKHITCDLVRKSRYLRYIWTQFTTATILYQSRGTAGCRQLVRGWVTLGRRRGSWMLTLLSCHCSFTNRVLLPEVYHWRTLVVIASIVTKVWLDIYTYNIRECMFNYMCNYYKLNYYFNQKKCLNVRQVGF